jgi:hypothetical protein
MSDQRELDSLWKGSMLDLKVVDRRKHENITIAHKDIKVGLVFACFLPLLGFILWMLVK